MSAGQTGPRFHREVLELVGEQLKLHGYVRKIAGIHHRPLASWPHASAWVGLPHARFAPNGTHDITPTVGIRDERVAAVQAAIDPRSPKAYEPTTGIRLTKAMPDGPFLDSRGDLIWTFDPETDYGLEAVRMADAIARYGIPFAERLAANDEELVAFVQTLRPVQATDEPQVLLAVGREEEASQAMDRLVTEAGDADSPYAEYVRELAVRFDAYLRDRD